MRKDTPRPWWPKKDPISFTLPKKLSFEQMGIEERGVLALQMREFKTLLFRRYRELLRDNRKRGGNGSTVVNVRYHPGSELISYLSAEYDRQGLVLLAALSTGNFPRGTKQADVTRTLSLAKNLFTGRVSSKTLYRLEEAGVHSSVIQALTHYAFM